jgi:hypothetical protein
MVAVSLYLRLTAKSLWALLALLLFDAAAVTAHVIVSYRKTDGGWPLALGRPIGVVLRRINAELI